MVVFEWAINKKLFCIADLIKAAKEVFHRPGRHDVQTIGREDDFAVRAVPNRLINVKRNCGWQIVPGGGINTQVQILDVGRDVRRLPFQLWKILGEIDTVLPGSPGYFQHRFIAPKMPAQDCKNRILVIFAGLAEG